MAERSRRLAAIDDDLTGALDLLAADPLVGPLVAERPGLRVPGTWDPYETGVRAIIGQQISVAGATMLAGRLVERCGTPVPDLAPFGLTHTFPPPEVLAATDLGGIGLPAARAAAIGTFAAAVAAGDVVLDRSIGLDELVASLVALPGIGPWTAQYLGMRLGEPDAFPAGDLGLRKATGTTAPELATSARRWRPWRALAAMHLWSSVRG